MAAIVLDKPPRQENVLTHQMSVHPLSGQSVLNIDDDPFVAAFMKAVLKMIAEEIKPSQPGNELKFEAYKEVSDDSVSTLAAKIIAAKPTILLLDYSLGSCKTTEIIREVLRIQPNTLSGVGIRFYTGEIENPTFIDELNALNEQLAEKGFKMARGFLKGQNTTPQQIKDQLIQAVSAES